MNPHRCSLFVPERSAVGREARSTFGRAPHGRFWHGFAVHSARGIARPECGPRLARRDPPGYLPPAPHFGGMERKAAEPSFFTERTLANYLAVSDRTIRNWIRRGELPSYKLGAARRIDPADVEDFLARHRDASS